MRLLDEDNDHSIDGMTSMLTVSEAEELRDSLEGLLEKPRDNHAHVANKDFSKEITVCIYDLEWVADFDERVQRLLKHDE